MPNVSHVTVSDTEFTITTYRTSDMSQVDTFTIYKTPEIVNPFQDVRDTDWFYQDVMHVYEAGLMQGVSDHVFAPNTGTTRAMAVTMLYRLAGEPAVKNHGFLPGRRCRLLLCQSRSLG
ncbi:MAG: S-layer homology domain-containing protein [Oscillospiraceae bacterium]